MMDVVVCNSFRAKFMSLAADVRGGGGSGSISGDAVAALNAANARIAQLERADAEHIAKVAKLQQRIQHQELDEQLK